MLRKFLLMAAVLVAINSAKAENYEISGPLQAAEIQMRIRQVFLNNQQARDYSLKGTSQIWACYYGERLCQPTFGRGLMDSLTSPQEIETLVRQLRDWDIQYHEEGNPSVSDATYDKKKENLRKLAPNHPYHKEVGAPVTFGKKHKLPIKMGSLSKLRPSGVKPWAAKTASPKHQGWMLLPKFDGAGGTLHYRHGKLINVFTRGKGKAGVNIGRWVTPTAKYVQGVRSSLKAGWQKSRYRTMLKTADLYVKVEFVIHNQIFDKKFRGKQVLAGKKPYSAPRNFVVGLINTVPKGGQVNERTQDALRSMTAIAYSLVFVNNGKEIHLPSKLEELQILAQLGFTTATNPLRYSKGHYHLKRGIKSGLYGKGQKEMLPVFGDALPLRTFAETKDLTEEYLKGVIAENSKLVDIFQDGLVIEPLNLEEGRKLGFETDGLTPRWARAVKLDTIDQETQTGTVKKIFWTISKRRLLKPTIWLTEPLDFQGAEINMITAHNAKTVVDEKLGELSLISVCRSGNVIPFWAGTLKATGPDLPNACTACGSKVRWNKNKVDLLCTNPRCEGQTAERLKAWFNIIKVDYMADITVTRLIDAGYTTIPKILRMSEKDFRKAGLGPNISKKLAKGMSQSLQGVSLATVAHASGLFNNEQSSLGSTRLEWILEEVGQDNFLRAPESVLRKLLAKAQGKGIGAETINIFLTGIEKFRKLHAQIADLITEPELESSGLQDVVAAWSGFRDGTMEEIVKTNGGKVSGSLSRKVTVLFHSGLTSKYTKAQEYNITCVPQEKAMTWLKKRIGEV